MNVDSEITLNKFKPRTMVGQQINHWFVLSEDTDRRDRRKRYFLCRCKCGDIQSVIGQTIKDGTSKQCRKCAFYKHGKSKSSVYKIWVGIIQRCTNENYWLYRFYGARGIKIDPHWLKFENFYACMGDRPGNLELDRINPSGNYEPGNCRWVPKYINLKNKIEKVDLMLGAQFGKWLVLNRISHKPDHWYYECKCSCGIIKVICGGELRRKKTTQCRTCSYVSNRDKNNIKRLAQ